MHNAKNVLITGIPRSGTTLLTSTVHQIPNCVAFGEPIQLKALKKTSDSPEAYAHRLADLLETLRRQILNGVPLPHRFDIASQQIASNYYRRVKTSNAYQGETTFEIREEVFEVQSENFTLCLKSNEQFTACLEALLTLAGVTIIAVIRNPVACILSWRSLKIPVSSGRLKAVERLAPELRKLKKIDDVLFRQVKIVDWFCAKFYNHRDKINIIAYEDFIQYPEVLRKFVNVPKDHVFAKHQSMNKRPEYNLQEEQRIRDYLKHHARYTQFFYPSC